MTEVTAISSIVGFFLPLVVQLVNAKIVSSKIKYWTSLGISVLVGLGITYFGGNFDVQNLLLSIGAVFTVSQTVYATYWKGSSLQGGVNKFITGQ